jgi:transcription elongation GreA/GreB family factor
MTLVVSICALCGGAVAAAVEICSVCVVAADTVATAARAAERRSAGDADSPARPVLTARDFAALERFARLRVGWDDPAARALLEALDRSRVVPADAVAADVAALGSRVIFSVDDRPPEARVLVLPARHAAAGWTLPVTTPRELALLGRAAGAVVTAPWPDGTATERLRVLAVVRGGGEGTGDIVAPHASVRGDTPTPETGGGVAPPPRRPVLFRSPARIWPVAPRLAATDGPSSTTG